MDQFSHEFYEYLAANTLVGIKGGTTRETFLDIWMVHIGTRVFARSYQKSARSWFTAFLDEGVGEIKYGDQVVAVRGVQLLDNPKMTEQINRTYLEKYDQAWNVPFAETIVQPEYGRFTMEFSVLETE